MAKARIRIAWLFVGLALAAGTLYCSGPATTPATNTCCLVATANGTVCYCGTSATAGSSFTVAVSGSTCTVTNTSDGGGDAQVTGSPPAAITDCLTPNSTH